MKNRLLLLSLVLVGSALSAQQRVKPSHEVATAKQVVSADQIPTDPFNGASVDITFIDTLYSNDFSDSTVFTQNVASGSSSEWVFGTNATIGNGGFFNAAFASSSAANGYAMFDYFGFNAAAQFANSTFTVGPIDLTAAVAPLTVNFEQYYAKFRDSAQVWYSLDGNNFTLLGDNTDLPLYGLNAQGQTIGSPTANGELKSIFADQLAGQSQVWIRFRYWSDDGGYSWLVDDLTITNVSVPAVDLDLVNLYSMDPVLLDYDITPLSQADTLVYGVVVTNNALTAASFAVNYDVQFNGASVASGSDLVGVIAPLQTDTLYFLTNYTPDQIGTYTLSATIVAEGDFTANNNTRTDQFDISEYIYSPVANLTGSYSESLSGSAAPYDAYKVGQFFYTKAAGTIYAANLAMPRPVGTANYPVELTIEIRDAADIENIINIADYVLDNTHPSGTQYKTVLFDPPVDLAEDKVYLLVVSTTDETKKFNFYAQQGDDDESTRAYGPFGVDNAINWFRGWTFTPCFQLTFDPEVAGLKPTDAGINLAVYPNPADANINIVMSMDNAMSATLNVLDIQGRIITTRNIESSLSVTESIPTSDLANGIYTLQVITEKGISTQKITVAH